MATSKTPITASNIHGWLASFGYIFPSTEGELARFERFYADMEIPEGDLLDPEVILGNKPSRHVNQITLRAVGGDSFQQLRMAARNGKGAIPQHILDKMKKNHNKPADGTDGPQTEKTD